MEFMINGRQWRYLLGLRSHRPPEQNDKSLPPLSRVELEELLSNGFIVPGGTGYTLTVEAKERIARGEQIYKSVPVRGTQTFGV